MVNHADSVGVKFQMDCNFGMTAVAENQVVIDKMIQIDKINNARKRPAGCGSMSNSVFTGSFAFVLKASFGRDFKKAMETSPARLATPILRVRRCDRLKGNS